MGAAWGKASSTVEQPPSPTGRHRRAQVGGDCEGHTSRAGRRIYIERVNDPFLFQLKGTPAEYKAGLERATSPVPRGLGLIVVMIVIADNAGPVAVRTDLP
jgi:hypothetical protein